MTHPLACQLISKLEAGYSLLPSFLIGKEAVPLATCGVAGQREFFSIVPSVGENEKITLFDMRCRYQRQYQNILVGPSTCLNVWYQH